MSHNVFAANHGCSIRGALRFLCSVFSRVHQAFLSWVASLITVVCKQECLTHAPLSVAPFWQGAIFVARCPSFQTFRSGKELWSPSSWSLTLAGQETTLAGWRPLGRTSDSSSSPSFSLAGWSRGCGGQCLLQLALWVADSIRTTTAVEMGSQNPQILPKPINHKLHQPKNPRGQELYGEKEIEATGYGALGAARTALCAARSISCPAVPNAAMPLAAQRPLCCWEVAEAFGMCAFYNLGTDVAHGPHTWHKRISLTNLFSGFTRQT